MPTIVLLVVVAIASAVLVALAGPPWASGVAMALLVLVLPGAALSYVIAPRAEADLRVVVALGSSIVCSLALAAVLTSLRTTDATIYAIALGLLTLAFAGFAAVRER